MSLYGDNPGPDAGRIARAIRESLEAAKHGVKIKTWWGDSGKNAEQLRQWFHDKIDGMINLKAGLRSDGAPKRLRDGQRCRCEACKHRDEWHAGNENVHCMHCRGRHEEYGGRKWSDDWDRHVRQTANMLNGTRVALGLHSIPHHLRKRLAHRVRDND